MGFLLLCDPGATVIAPCPLDFEGMNLYGDWGWFGFEPGQFTSKWIDGLAGFFGRSFYGGYFN